MRRTRAATRDGYEQMRLWGDAPVAPPGPADQPSPPPASSADRAPSAVRPDATPPAPTSPDPRRDPELPSRARPSASAVRPVPKATPRPRPPESGLQAGPTASEALDDEGMEHAADWVEQLLEDSSGGTAAPVRAFVRAFPPAARWGEPWPPGMAEEGLPAFAPAAPSYAAALREVAAGRRRVRIQGRWAAGGRGTLHAGVRETLADEGPTWSIIATGP